MAPDTNIPAAKSEDDLRQLPKWARRYAQNRTLRIVVTLGIILAGAGVFLGLGYLSAWAFRRDNSVLMWACLAALWAFIGWWLWFAFVGASRLIPRITQRLYHAEGSVSMGGAPDTELPQLPNLSICVLLLFATAHMFLIQRGVLPERYVQPIAVLYVVPFMLWVGLRLRPSSRSPFMCLWPALFVIHGVLIVAGVPISRGIAFDIFVPTVGYGLIAALAGHIYSRVALRRLRAVAATARTHDEAKG